MGRDPNQIKFVAVEAQERARVESLIGQEVPISLCYCLGAQPRLIAIEGERALLEFRNGARLWNVPLRDLVDDRGYWKR